MTRRKAEPVITLRIEPGPTTPAARESWRRWWRARVAEARAGGHAETDGQAEARDGTPDNEPKQKEAPPQ